MIKARLIDLKSTAGLAFGHFANQSQSFYMLATDIDANIKEVSLGFKPNDCIIAKNKLQSSVCNELFVSIKAISKGEICTILTLFNDFCEFEALISTQAFDILKLNQKDEVYAYIKASSVYIEEILC